MFFYNFYFFNLIIKDLLLPFLRSLILIIFVIIGVAFLTLLERKVLRYIQIRKGPNKIGIFGVFQPFCDAIKLFSKEQTFPNYSNYIIYYFSPIFSLFLSLLVWICFPMLIKFFRFNLGVIFFFSCLRCGVYSVILAGWSSNSIYSLLGRLRAVAQTISYEVRLVLIFISLIFLIESYNFFNFIIFQEFIWFIIFIFPISLGWIASSLAETNRTPFDFAEGESELVSGFNVEYSRGGFALIFLAEYARILFIRIVFRLIFLGGNIFNLIFFLKLVFVSFIFIWVRGTLPRFRYDKLMYLAWKIFLPFSLNYLVLIIGLKLFYFSL